MFGPVANSWVVVTSLVALPVTSFWTSFLRLPSRSYSYCCQYGDGPPTLGLPATTAGPVALVQPPMFGTLGWAAAVWVPVSVQAWVSRPR